MSAFSRYIGIDYSGAETPEASLKGLRVYCAVGEAAANEVPPPPSPRKYWTRRGIAPDAEIEVIPVIAPTVTFYRDLYDRVGRPCRGRRGPRRH